MLQFTYIVNRGKRRNVALADGLCKLIRCASAISGGENAVYISFAGQAYFYDASFAFDAVDQTFGGKGLFQDEYAVCFYRLAVYDERVGLVIT